MTWPVVCELGLHVRLGVRMPESNCGLERGFVVVAGFKESVDLGVVSLSGLSFWHREG